MTAPASILIVDDEPANRRLLQALLAPEGYRIRTAADGAEALVSIAADPPDLILLDVMMPGIDGHVVATAVKAASTRNIPIIMVTAQTDREARLAALDAGAEDFLTKPIDRAELWLRVRNLLRLKELSDLLEGQAASLDAQVQARTADLQRFRSAMDAAGDAIILVDRATMRIIEVNATASRMLGYTRAELLELRPMDIETGSCDQLTAMYDMLIAGQHPNGTTETARRKDRSTVPVEVHRHVHDSGGDWIVVEVMRDITERTEAEGRLQHQAHYDALTNLPNRALFHETLSKALSNPRAHGQTLAVMLLDLDGFKNVNDTLGHAIGDELLRQVSDRLVGCIRVRDTVGRLGGDEFGLILGMNGHEHDAAIVATKIQAALVEPFDLFGHLVGVTASIGITLFPEDASDTGTLLKFADTAMYQAKQAGRAGFRFFTSAMNVEVLRRLEIETALRRAVANEEFVLHYQPKVRLADGQVVGLEALLRWDRPGHGIVPPGEFIPALEAYGLVVEVGRWVIDAACRQIGEWAGRGIGPMQIAVNVSEQQFVRGDLEADVVRALDTHGVDATLLELELTETALMTNADRTITILQNLKQRGVRVSIDDFGTGYSSLAYLRRFPIDKLKIDRSFINDITDTPDAAAIALAVINIGHSLGLEVIAEGVETASQLAYLRRHGCDQMQGYYFSRPLAAPALEQLLLAGTHIPEGDVDATAPAATVLLVNDDAEVLEDLQVLFAADGYRLLIAGTAEECFMLLAMHDVQLMVCDQRIHGVTDTNFLGRVKDLHPGTLQIVLSDYTDSDTLIDTINRGGVHRYVTAPWSGQELRHNVRDGLRQQRWGRCATANAEAPEPLLD